MTLGIITVMNYDSIFEKLKTAFPKTKIFQNHPLASYTTVKIGGPADIFIDCQNTQQLIDVLQFIYKNKLETPTILGCGSNVLISDSGIKGIVIHNVSQNIKILSPQKCQENKINEKIDTQRKENDPQKYLNFNSLDYDESSQPQIEVEIDSGVLLPYAINYLISQKITGLQWFAYIPATIGGSIYSNIHGGKYHIADYLKELTVFNQQTGNIETINKKDIPWGYDYSFFQENHHLIILSATLNLYLGDYVKAKQVVNSWINQKSLVQPMNSAGSVFKNPSLKDCQKIWGEQKSTGWIIDHELNWKDKQIGNAQISPLHANFIVNNGQATAEDYYSLAKSIQTEVYNRFKLKLEFEIKFLGKF